MKSRHDYCTKAALIESLCKKMICAANHDNNSDLSRDDAIHIAQEHFPVPNELNQTGSASVLVAQISKQARRLMGEGV